MPPKELKAGTQNRYLYTNVYSSMTHDDPQGENNPNVHGQMNRSTTRGVSIQQNGIHIQSKGILAPATCMGPKDTRLLETGQPQKDKHQMIPQIWGT